MVDMVGCRVANGSLFNKAAMVCLRRAELESSHPKVTHDWEPPRGWG